VTNGEPPIRLLTFSTLFPNQAAPNHGVFVENRLRELVRGGGVEAQVLAPVPWFWSRHPRFGAWARHAAAPATETRSGLAVHHPRFLAIPRIGMRVSPHLLYRTAAGAMTRLLAQGDKFDLIDAHYFYPDGVAANWLGKRFGLPVVITGRGSDLTQFPQYAGPRRLIRDAALAADGIITVSDGLRRALGQLGVPAARVTVLRNGVDLSVFKPMLPDARQAARAALGITGPALVSVGGLIPRKGHDLTIAALAHLPAWRLLIAGEGPERSALAALAVKLGLAGRVQLLGPRPHESLPELYAAADISVLSSAREGWANVLLESIACGTPVVASPIAGNDEVIRAAAAGTIAAARTPEAIAAAVLQLWNAQPDRAATAAYAEAFSWEATSAGQMALFREILAKRKQKSPAEPGGA
jgi:glycosyltransferase involved in cell wall biosynthesis